MTTLITAAKETSCLPKHGDNEDDDKVDDHRDVINGALTPEIVMARTSN